MQERESGEEGDGAERSGVERDRWAVGRAGWSPEQEEREEGEAQGVLLMR